MNEVVTIATAIRGSVPDKAIQWIIGQSAHETGYQGKPWNSPVFHNLNNGFGMLHPSRRKTLSIGKGSNQPNFDGGGAYATYHNLSDSAKDLVLWLNYNKIPWKQINSSDDYISFIKRKGYFGATESSYLTGVKYWIKKLNIPVFSATVGILLIAALVTWYIFKS